MGKATRDAWESIGQQSDKGSDKGQDKRKGKPTGASPAREGRRVSIGTYVPESLHLDVKTLALELERERGERVTIADLVSEALEDLLNKYGRK